MVHAQSLPSILRLLKLWTRVQSLLGFVSLAGFGVEHILGESFAPPAWEGKSWFRAAAVPPLARTRVVQLHRLTMVAGLHMIGQQGDS